MQCYENVCPTRKSQKFAPKKLIKQEIAINKTNKERNQGEGIQIKIKEIKHAP